MSENNGSKNTDGLILETQSNHATLEEPAETEGMKIQVTREVREVLQQLEAEPPGITEGVATALGSGTGAGGQKNL